MRADVQSLMAGELGQWLQQQTAMRDEARERANNRWFYGALGAIPLLAFLWIIGPFSFMVNTIITVVGAGLVYGWGYAPIAEATKEIKVGINSAIARSLGVEYRHDASPGAEFEACRVYGLVPSFDRSDFEDRWYGDVEGHGFDLYEAHLEERRGSGKNKRWVTVFRGAIIAMEFGRAFNSTTLLQRAGKHKKWFGLGGRKDSVKFRGHQLDYVDQVHPAFEDVFEVWSDDQVEARTLVHPNYVEHLLNLEKAFHGEAIRALFSRNSVVIAVQTENLFESGSIDAQGDAERVAEAARQFGALAELALSINQTERGRVMGKVESEGAGPLGRGRQMFRGRST